MRTNQTSVELRMVRNTRKVIKTMAWHTAQGTDQRAMDAREHCERLDINPDLPLAKQL